MSILELPVIVRHHRLCPYLLTISLGRGTRMTPTKLICMRLRLQRRPWQCLCTSKRSERSRATLWVSCQVYNFNYIDKLYRLCKINYMIVLNELFCSGVNTLLLLNHKESCDWILLTTVLSSAIHMFHRCSTVLISRPTIRSIPSLLAEPSKWSATSGDSGSGTCEQQSWQSRLKTVTQCVSCFIRVCFTFQLFHRNWRKRGARKTTTLGPSRGCPFHSFRRQNSLPFKSSSGFEMFESGSRINWDILVNICSFNGDAYLMLSNLLCQLVGLLLLMWILFDDFNSIFKFHSRQDQRHQNIHIHGKMGNLMRISGMTLGLVGPSLQVAQLHDLQCAVDGRRDLDLGETLHGQSTASCQVQAVHGALQRFNVAFQRTTCRLSRLSFVPSGRQQGYSVALGDIPWDTAQVLQIAVLHKPISP